MKWKMLVLVLTVLMGLSLVPLAPGTQAAEDVDWVLHDTSPIERIVYVYAELPDGRIFISSGNNVTDMTLTNETWIYDPYTKDWQRVADAFKISESGAAVAMPDGKVYMFGGMYGGLLTNVLVYDVATDIWSEGPLLPIGGIIAEAVAIDDHRILIAGGLDGSSLSDATEKCFFFDTTTSTFSPAPDLPDVRFGGVMVVSGSNAYYLGGSDGAGTAHTDIFAYSINGDYWMSVGDLPEPLVHHAAVAGGDGNIYVMGGRSAFSWWSTGSDRAYAFNTFTKEVISIPDLVAPVLNAAAFELDDGRIMYLMGNNASEGNTDVYTMQAWEASASLSSSSVEQGSSVWLHVSITSNFMEMFGVGGAVYLSKDNATYGSYYLDSVGENDMLLELAISESMPAGTYEITFESVNIGYGWDQSIPFDPLYLTVVGVPTTDQQLQDLQDQNQALQDQLSALSDELNDTRDELGGDLDDARAELADVKASADGKLDAMIGYLILVLVLVTLVVAVIVLVRKK